MHIAAPYFLVRSTSSSPMLNLQLLNSYFFGAFFELLRGMFRPSSKFRVRLNKIPSILPGGQPSASPLEDLGQQTGTSVTWLVNIAAGTSLGLTLRDSTGAVAQSAPFSVLASSTFLTTSRL